MQSSESVGKLTSQQHWDDAYVAAPRPRLPSRWLSGTRSVQRLLRAHIEPADRVLEIGCSPGKHLAWVAAALRANVSGLDYSAPGIAHTRQLFAALHLEGDFRCEDVLETTFPPGSFDVTYSLGVIEHFDDPRPIVRRHVELTRAGGTVVITIPNYGALYGRLQRQFDPANLELHNLSIMSVTGLRDLAPADLAADVRAFPFGRVGAGLVNWGTRLPAPIARGLTYSANAVGLLQPTDVRVLCPWLVLTLQRR